MFARQYKDAVLIQYLLKFEPIQRVIDPKPRDTGERTFQGSQERTGEVFVQYLAIHLDDFVDGRQVVLLGEPDKLMHQPDADGRDVQQEIRVDIVDSVEQTSRTRDGEKWRFDLGRGPRLPGILPE